LLSACAVFNLSPVAERELRVRFQPRVIFAQFQRGAVIGFGFIDPAHQLRHPSALEVDLRLLVSILEQR